MFRIFIGMQRNALTYELYFVTLTHLVNVSETLTIGFGSSETHEQAEGNN
jgi:hypothetical protein